MDLLKKKCKPCEGKEKPLSAEHVKPLMAEVSGWELDGGIIRRRVKFANFNEAIKFVNKVATLAESEGHHPDITISWNKVTLELTTHAVKGLSENDFIMAAKINEMNAAC